MATSDYISIFSALIAVIACVASFKALNVWRFEHEAQIYLLVRERVAQASSKWALSINAACEWAKVSHKIAFNVSEQNDIQNVLKLALDDLYASMVYVRMTLDSEMLERLKITDALLEAIVYHGEITNAIKFLDYDEIKMINISGYQANIELRTKLLRPKINSLWILFRKS